MNIGYQKHAISFIDESEFIICGGLTEENTKIAKVRTIKINFNLIKDSSNQFEIKNTLNVYTTDEINDMIEPD